MAKKTDPQKALAALDQAWSYYEPERLVPEPKREPDWFDYANAA